MSKCVRVNMNSLEAGKIHSAECFSYSFFLKTNRTAS